MTHLFPLLQIQTINKLHNCNGSICDLTFYMLIPHTSTMWSTPLGRVSPDNWSVSTIYMYRLLGLSGVHRTTDTLVSSITGFEHLFITDRTKVGIPHSITQLSKEKPTSSVSSWYMWFTNRQSETFCAPFSKYPNINLTCQRQ